MTDESQELHWQAEQERLAYQKLAIDQEREAVFRASHVLDAASMIQGSGLPESALTGSDCSAAELRVEATQNLAIERAKEWYAAERRIARSLDGDMYVPNPRPQPMSTGFLRSWRVIDRRESQRWKISAWNGLGQPSQLVSVDGHRARIAVTRVAMTNQNEGSVDLLLEIPIRYEQFFRVNRGDRNGQVLFEQHRLVGWVAESGENFSDGISAMMMQGYFSLSVHADNLGLRDVPNGSSGVELNFDASALIPDGTVFTPRRREAEPPDMGREYQAEFHQGPESGPLPTSPAPAQRWHVICNRGIGGGPATLIDIDDQSAGLPIESLTLDSYIHGDHFGSGSQEVRARVQIPIRSVPEFLSDNRGRRVDQVRIGNHLLNAWSEELSGESQSGFESLRRGHCSLLVRVENLEIRHLPGRSGETFELRFDATAMPPRGWQWIGAETSLPPMSGHLPSHLAPRSGFDREECKFYVGNSFLMCSANPYGPCSECKIYESK